MKLCKGDKFRLVKGEGMIGQKHICTGTAIEPVSKNGHSGITLTNGDSMRKAKIIAFIWAGIGGAIFAVCFGWAAIWMVFDNPSSVPMRLSLAGEIWAMSGLLAALVIHALDCFLNKKEFP